MKNFILGPLYIYLFSFLQLCLYFTENEGNVSPEFILTPLIRSGNLAKAKSLSKVEPFTGYDFTSYAGYLTIDENYDSNIYFWYFLAKDSDNAPVITFTNGGPGATSLYGLFGEVGPVYVLPNLTLVGRDYDWSKEFNLLIIELPTGAGFSFTKSIKGYAKTHEDIGRQGYQFLQQFFTLFSEHRNNDLYIAGESFGGAYPFYVALEIAEKNSHPSSKLKINLKGVISISGSFDIPAMRLTTEYLYNMGLLTDKDKTFFEAIEVKVMKLCEEGLYLMCYRTLSPLLLYNPKSLVSNVTGYAHFFNINNVRLPTEFVSFYRLLELSTVRKKIHAGDVPPNPQIAYTLTKVQMDGSYMHDHKTIVNAVLDKNYKVLIMTGQLDLDIAPLYQRRFIEHLVWKGREEYNAAERIIWRVDPTDVEVAGYVTSVRNLVEIMVRNAGHMIPFDNPRASWDALKRFVYDKSFS